LGGGGVSSGRTFPKEKGYLMNASACLLTEFLSKISIISEKSIAISIGDVRLLFRLNDGQWVRTSVALNRDDTYAFKLPEERWQEAERIVSKMQRIGKILSGGFTSPKVISAQG
jgi:hypothetical protein